MHATSLATRIPMRGLAAAVSRWSEYRALVKDCTGRLREHAAQREELLADSLIVVESC